MQSGLAPTWQMIVLRGVLAFVFGVLALFLPISTALALITVFGVWAFVDGVVSVVQAFVRPNPGLIRVALALMGLAGVVVGIFAVLHPIRAAVTLTWLLGIWLIARGILGVVLVFGDVASTPRWLIVLGAVADFVLGLLLALNPGKGALGIAALLGIVAIAWGVAFVAAGLVLRKETTTPDPAAVV